MGQQPSSSLQYALALWWSLLLKMVGQPMAQYGRGSRYGAVGCVVICLRVSSLGCNGRGRAQAAVLGQTDSWQKQANRNRREND